MEMDRKDFSGIGEEIKDIVQDAINTRDFNRLNTEIANTVNYALNEFRRSFGRSGGQEKQNGRMGRTGEHAAGGGQECPRQHREERTAATRQRENRSGRGNFGRSGWKVVKNAAGRYVYVRTEGGRDRGQQEPDNRPVPAQLKPKGRVAGILFTIFGAIGLSAGLLAGIMIAGRCLAEGVIIRGLLGAWIGFGMPVLTAGAAMLCIGRIKSRRVQRYKIYLNRTESKGYCQLSELAAATGHSEKYVARDLRKMIRTGMFPEGHIDKDETCFILNKETYGLYLDMLKSEEERLDTPNSGAQEDGAGGVARVVSEGREYIRQIREANEAIPGEKISGQLSRLELVTEKIFYFIEQHPQKIPDIHRFMEYYLPTTLKLVNTYKEFDSQPIQGENITVGKREIEGTLDTIIEAFSSLLDSMFEEAALDVSTDISVLRTMFAQEGLTKKDFAHKG